MGQSDLPENVGLNDWLGPPLEDALKRAYYYTEAGAWRGPEVDEWERWHAVAKVVAQKVATERERCAKMAVNFTDPMDGEYAKQDTRIVAGCIAAAIRGA